MPKPVNPKIVALASAELAGDKLSDWGKQHGVSPRTIRRWRSRPDYQDHLARQQDRVIQGVVLFLTNEALKSARTIVNLRDNSKNEQVSLAASKALLHSFLAVHSYAEGQVKLDTVLDLLSEIKGNGHAQFAPYKLTPPAS
jgi:hypothetical protein